MAAKISKKDAGYGPGQPHCGICKHYIEEDESAEGAETDEASEPVGTCQIVMGDIDEDDWCKLYRPARRPTLAEGGG